MPVKISTKTIIEYYDAFSVSQDYERFFETEITARLSDVNEAIENFADFLPHGAARMMEELCDIAEDAAEELGFIMGFQYACNLLNEKE